MKKICINFPGVKEKYIRVFGDSYQCNVPNWKQLDDVFQEEIVQAQISSRIPVFKPEKMIKKSSQISLFGE